MRWGAGRLYEVVFAAAVRSRQAIVMSHQPPDLHLLSLVVGVATLRGTLPWIAPEIIKTPGTCTEAVDVYSFGKG